MSSVIQWNSYPSFLRINIILSFDLEGCREMLYLHQQFILIYNIIEWCHIFQIHAWVNQFWHFDNVLCIPFAFYKLIWHMTRVNKQQWCANHCHTLLIILCCTLLTLFSFLFKPKISRLCTHIICYHRMHQQ